MNCTCHSDVTGGFCRQHPSEDPVGDLRRYLKEVAPIGHDMTGGGEDLLLAVIRHLDAGRRRCAFFTTSNTCCHPESRAQGSVAAAPEETP